MLSKIYTRAKKSKAKELALDHRGLSQLQDVTDLNKYKQLQVLRLNGNALFNFSGLVHTRTLEELYLQYNQIVDLDNFPTLPQLKILDLSSNRLESIPTLNLPRLSDLNLEGNNLTATSLTGLPRSVRILNLRNNRLADLNQVLEALSQCSHLESLDLSLNPLTTSNPEYQKSIIRFFPTLRVLNGHNVQTPTTQQNQRNVSETPAPNIRRTYKLRYERLTQHPRPEHFKLSETTLPTKVDLISLSPVFSPQNWQVWDQGNLGSCTAFAMLSTVHYYDSTTQPSTLFQYYNERLQDGDVNDDNGSTLSQATQCLAKYGYCTAESWPYDPNQFMTAPPQSCYDQALPNIEDKNLQFESIDYSQQTIMHRLAQNCPIVMGISVYESFESEVVATTGQVPMPKPNEQLLGGHAVSIVGYDTTTCKWKVRNSWGPNWGDQGYFYLPFDYICEGQLASDLWSAKQGFIVPSPAILSSFRASAPSLSINNEPGSPRYYTTIFESEGPAPKTKLPLRSTAISVLMIDPSLLSKSIDNAIQDLPSIETVITTVIGILTLIQQIVQDILTVSGGPVTNLTLDQKAGLVIQCSGTIIDALLNKKIITGNLALAANSSIKSMSIQQAQSKSKFAWWKPKRQQQVTVANPSFGIIVS